MGGRVANTLATRPKDWDARPERRRGMITRAALPLLLVSALALAARAGEETTEKHKDSTPAGLEQFKKLAGDWVGKTEGLGKESREVHVTYKVTSGGSAVIETSFPNTEHEMVTVIHPDGDNLLLTHYCMLGNQPQMKAPGKADGNKFAFKFIRATNLKSDKDMHMHDVTYTFVDKDTLKAEWTHYRDGKAGGQVVIELKRQK
jgi:hypothetical protein